MPKKTSNAKSNKKAPVKGMESPYRKCTLSFVVVLGVSKIIKSVNLNDEVQVAVIKSLKDEKFEGLIKFIGCNQVSFTESK